MIQIPEEPKHLCDLLKGTYWIRQISLGNVLETLVIEDPKTYRIRPGLAKQWKFSVNKTRLSFTLHKGITFHDGKPLTARDVIFTLDTLMDKTFPNSAKRGDFAFLKSWKAVGDHRVVFELKKANAFTLLNFTDLQIYPRHVFAGRSFAAVCATKTLIGSGPYRLEKWQNQQIHLRRNDRYWRPRALPKLKRLLFRKVSAEKLALALKLGEIDVAPNLPASQVSAVKKLANQGKRLKLNTYPGNTYSLLAYNLKRKPFKNKTVRIALTMIVDLETVRKSLYGGHAQLAFGPFHVLSAATPKIPRIQGDNKSARRLLADGGYTDSDGDGVLDDGTHPLKLTLLFRAGSKQHKKLAPYIRDRFARFGIKVELRPLSWSKLLAAIPKKEFDMFLFQWGPIPYHYDPSPFFHSKGDLNWVGYSDPEVDRRLTAAQGEFDASRRLAIYRWLAERLYRRQIVQFHFVPAKHVVTSHCVAGMYPSAIGLQFRDWFIRAK